MKKKINSIIAFTISTCLVMLPLIGCSGRNVPQQEQNGTTQQGRNLLQENTQGTNPNAIPRIENTPGSNGNTNPEKNFPESARLGTNPGTSNTGVQFSQQQITDGMKKSDTIKNQLNTMSEIKNANVVVLGNTALVGFNTANTGVDAAKARDLVVNKVKQADPSITNVLATDSQDLLSGINRLGEDIASGKPANAIGNSFNQIVRNIRVPGV